MEEKVILGPEDFKKWLNDNLSSEQIRKEVFENLYQEPQSKYGFVHRKCPLCDTYKRISNKVVADESIWICWDCKKAFKEMKKYLNSHQKHSH